MFQPRKTCFLSKEKRWRESHPHPPSFLFTPKTCAFDTHLGKIGGAGVCSFKVTSTSQFWRDDGSRIWQLWQPVSEQTAAIAAATNTPVRKLNSFRTVHNKILGSNPYASRHQVEKVEKNILTINRDDWDSEYHDFFTVFFWRLTALMMHMSQHDIVEIDNRSIKWEYNLLHLSTVALKHCCTKGLLH